MADDVPIQKTRGVGARCLCLNARRAARRLSRRFDEAFRPLGLTNGQFSLLAALNRPAPPTLGAVARDLAMDRTSLTATLKPLERRRLVTSRVDPEDRRGRRLRLTAKGRGLLARALPLWEHTHAEVAALLEPGAADALRSALGSLG